MAMVYEKKYSSKPGWGEYFGVGGELVQKWVPDEIRAPSTPEVPNYSSAINSLISSHNQAFAEAKAMNEARYQQLLNIANQTTGQRMTDVRSDYAMKGADIAQQLARTGLANTTIAPTMQMGLEREKQSALNRVADELQGTKLGIIERREDMYPDTGGLMSIIAAALGSGMAGSGSALGNLQF